MHKFDVTLYLRGGGTVGFPASADSVGEVEEQMGVLRSQPQIRVTFGRTVMILDSGEVVGFAIEAKN